MGRRAAPPRRVAARRDRRRRPASWSRSAVEGDSFFAVFSSPNDAVAAVCRIQTSLASEPLGRPRCRSRVRAALHTAAGELRDGDYFGPAVNRCARTERSATVAKRCSLRPRYYFLVRDVLPSDALVADLGEHRLRDLARPEHPIKIVTAGLPATFPPLKSLDHTNLNQLARGEKKKNVLLGMIRRVSRKRY